MLSNTSFGNTVCLSGMVDLRHVRYFVATADHGSVSAAAAHLHATQPSLSRQLRQLEHELDVELFERRGGRLTLSRTGRELLAHARTLLKAEQDLVTAARLHASGHVQRLTIAAPTVTLTDVISPFVASMTPEDPIINVQPADGSSAEEMLSGGADLAVSSRRPAAVIATRLIATFPVAALVPAGDPWAARAAVDLDVLHERDLIVLPRTAHARDALDTALAVTGRSHASLIEAANGTIAQALAASGRGIAVATDEPLFGLHQVPIVVDGDPVVVPLHAAWEPTSPAAPTIDQIATRLHDWVSDHFA